MSKLFIGGGGFWQTYIIWFTPVFPKNKYHIGIEGQF